MGLVADKVSAQSSLEILINWRTFAKTIFSTTIIFHLYSNKNNGVPSALDSKLFPTLSEVDPIMKLLSLHN